MRFVRTKRASPVALKRDLPDSRDYFHLEATSIDDAFLLEEDYIIDKDWWDKQFKRCKHGVLIPDAIEPGGEFLVDGIDCEWSEDGRDCYLIDLDFTLKDRMLFIPPRMYFYLNFWWIKGVVTGTKTKDVIQPRFMDLSWLNWMIKHVARDKGKDMSWFKARQKGLSEEAACDVAYEYLFINNSQSIIVASLELYAENTMNMVLRGLERLRNTQFFKTAKRGHDRSDYKKSQHTGSEIFSLTAKDNIQILSGKTPSLVYCEEVGIWKKGNPKAIYQFIDPSIRNLGNKTGWINYIGTGGEADDAISDMQEMYFSPDSFNLMSFRNKYDETSDVRVGYFVPSTAFKVLDEDGNSLVAEASKIEDEERLKKSPKERYLHVLLNPKNPDELFQLKGGGFFGPDIAQWAQERKMKILNYREKQVAHRYRLEWINPLKFTDGVRAIPYSEGENLEDYNIHISEPPELDSDNQPIKGLYKAGCFVESEKIPTNKGLKNVEDITFQDKLINEDGKDVDIWRIIKTLVEDEDVYKLKMSNTERTSTVTKEHPCLISKPKFYPNLSIDEKSFDFKYVDAEDIEIGDWTRVPNLYNKENTDFDKYWIEENIRIDRKLDNPLKKENFWWFVGLWIGDGYCSNKGKKVHLSINKNEEHTIKKLEDVCISIFDRKLQKRMRNNCIEAYFSLEQLNIFLSENFKKYANGKIIPEWVKYLPNEYKKELLLGYLDSDGCIYKDRKRNYYSLSYVSINLELLEGFQDILFSLGIVSNICKLRKAKQQIIRGKIINSKECYQLRLGHNDTLKIAQLFNCKENTKLQKIDYDNLSKTRIRPKQDCFISEDDKYIYFKIKDITKSKYDGYVYNYECDTHTYIGKHLGCHNCDSYDQDEAKTSSSKGACAILKTFHNANKTYNKFVAYVLERPGINQGGRDVFYENTAKLCMLYSAINLIEHSKLLIFPWYEKAGLGHMLALKPSYVVTNLVDNSLTTNRYGIDASLLPYGLKMLKDFLTFDNINQIDFVDLLDAFSKFKLHKDYNCDITVACAWAVVQKEEDTLSFTRQKETSERQNRIRTVAYKMINGRIVTNV